MTDTPPLTPTAPLRGAALDLARSVLMGVGTPLLAKGLVTADNWQAMVGGLLALASAVWSYVAAHPGKTGLIATLQGLARAGGQSQAWNGDLGALEAALLPLIERNIDKAIHQRAGFLAGPLDGVANTAIRDAAGQAVQHLRIT